MSPRKPKPILFSAPMVRALLDGRKTQTRRNIKDAPSEPGWLLYSDARGLTWIGPNGYPSMPCVLRFAKGDRLWVRETWRTGKSLDDASPAKIATMCTVAGWRRPWCPIKYEADGATENADELRDFGGEWGKTRVAIHMPRWASRLTNIVTDVRVQRLQDISETDAIAEGIQGRTITCSDGVDRFLWFGVPECGRENTPVAAYGDLWDSINSPRSLCAEDAPGSWDANPWIVALAFTVEHRNIDAIEKAAA